MTLRGASLLVLCAILVVAVIGATVVLWPRLAGRGPALVLARVGALLVCQLAAVLLLLVAVNDQFELYSSWTDLVGGYGRQTSIVEPIGPTPAPRGTTPPATGVPHLDSTPVPPTLPPPGEIGTAHPETWHGALSGATAPVWVWLPPQYAEPRYATTRFPVLEAFPGYPGVPATWISKIGLAKVLDEQIKSGAVRPTILVVPTITVAPPRDTECTDVPNGPQAETWLTTDLRANVLTRFRASTSPRDWSTIGYSTGAFCAVKLVLRHPEIYHAAASLAGYFRPSHDITTGDLFAGSTAVRDQNDPMWLAAHRPPAGQAFFLMGTREDGATVVGLRAFAARLRPPDAAVALVLRHGGHNLPVWHSVLPQALSYLDSTS